MHGVAVAVVAGMVAGAITWWADRDRAPAPAPAPARLPPPPACGGFDFPVGAPDGAGYYDAQPFGEADHLGEDWNGTAGGDSDLGDPVLAIADGVVSVAEDFAGGWGLVVRIVHPCGDRPGAEVESLYAHLATMTVAPGATVARGEPIGTIGTAHGRYIAHLHLELRERAGLSLGPGYAAGAARAGYLDPSAFIARHRPAAGR